MPSFYILVIYRLLSKVTQAYDFCQKQILQQCLSGENRNVDFLE